MFDGLKEQVTTIVDTLFPGHCVHCGGLTERGAVYCRECLVGLERPKEPVCVACGQPKAACLCRWRTYHFDGVTAPFWNKGAARTGVYALKFRRVHQVVPFFADQMAQTVRQRFASFAFDGVIAVPCRRFDELTRGYNHAELLAKALAKRLELPVLKGVLKHRLATVRQHDLPRGESRFENARRSYELAGPVTGRRLLLVDDIITSGATMDACALLLKRGGAQQVFCATALLGEKTIEKNDSIGYNDGRKEEVRTK